MTEPNWAKISVVIPVKNEEETILSLLQSFEELSVYPSEIIIVDGGSEDKTAGKIDDYINASKLPCEIRLIRTKEALPGRGRNIGIKNAKNEIIACTDAGGTVSRDWVKELSEPFQKDLELDVVIGNCSAIAETPFHKSLFFINLLGLMKKNVVFSGAVSIAFRKRVWETAGTFPEELYPCEDKYFLSRLKASKAKIIFSDNAVVYWRPRKNLLEFGIQYFKYGRADGKINFVPQRYLFRFLSYALLLMGLLLFLKSPFILFMFLALAFAVYPLRFILRSFFKIKSKLVFIYIPAILLTKDIAQMSGYLFGVIDRMNSPYFKKLSKGLK